MPEVSSRITRCATSILQAWQQQDMQLLSTELDQALDAAPAASAQESERRELLQEIAREIRRTHVPPGSRAHTDAERIGVCIGLLEHLVATD